MFCCRAIRLNDLLDMGGVFLRLMIALSRTQLPSYGIYAARNNSGFWNDAGCWGAVLKREMIGHVLPLGGMPSECLRQKVQHSRKSGVLPFGGAGEGE